MRLIDADALIERIESDIKAIEDENPVMAMGAIGVLNMIKKAPTSKDEESITIQTGQTYGKSANVAGDLDTDLISRQAIKYHTQLEAMGNGQYEEVEVAYKSDIESLPSVEDMGEVSDGYHTFNQLYHQRAVLFATIVNQNKDKAWKSWKHEDGKFCFDKEKEWFIVGVDTPEGSYTYHYEKKYWDLFDCEELDRGKHWDGHTDDDVTRLLSLPSKTHTKRTETHGVCSDCISRADTIRAMCKECEFSGKCEGDCTEVAVVRGMPPVEPERPKRTETMMVDGEPTEIDPLSYEVGYSHGQPERPKGEWILDGGTPICSVCHEEPCWSSEEYYFTDFCPNCGADCRGEEDD